ncbi:hypothetical protein CPJCM30710_19540 [Clostridium polyendosporum]|uniref:Uncharacterized protein n=1 Tax=Clostridium polyendosporum TaxID=69208 RepID=A0A919S2B1_9CLOT|nr:hypothetical protein [Clostridium polyendosporum]GIM29288.1 hypothetical protein CPJCM30710_19540 [Clostridium polyendosporum]
MPISNLYTILVVDDNQNNLFTVKALIQEYIKANVVLAGTPARAYKDASEDESIATGLITTKFARG